jgi:vacuolar-type H+-ATPase subunit I/STV1
MSDRGSAVGGSGWSMFAGVFLAIAGLFNAIDGIVALVDKEYFNEAGLVYQNLAAWGWALLIIGILQLIIGYMIIGRSEVARWAGLVIAVLSMVVAFFAIGMYPWWAIMIIVIDGVVIWGLTARWEE